MIKRLTDFKDEKAIEVVGELLEPIQRIAANEENSGARNTGLLGFAKTILKNNSKDVMNMLAILSEVKPEEYHCSAATVLIDVINMLSDEELLALFGLQKQTMT